MSNYQSELVSLAEMFKALGNVHRLAILKTLSCCCTPGAQGCGLESGAGVGELSGGLEIAASTVSHHIKELGRSGLLNSTKQGKNTYCCADKDALRMLSGFFASLADSMEDCCLTPISIKE